ncbi:hypothetical protein [Dactylosporangium sp. CA-092794]|uniref:hypothetical protein n=1 Tax=Dactylosporangium sp. CA-092794 TaxID=3239929 RepID=UPI003D949969
MPVTTAALTVGAGDVVLADAAATSYFADLADRPGVVASQYPPRREAAEALAALVGRRRPERVVAVGDGATLDVAKHAHAGGAELVLVPVGAEPWRAFAPFTSLYEPSGQRISRPAPAVAAARVVIDPAALSARAAPVRALQRADTAVHAVEVLLSRRAQEWDRAHAGAALAALRRDRPADDVVAAGLAATAFAATGLGLAHAAASPLGAAALRTHDTVNVLLAPYVAEFWGDRADWTAVAEGLGAAPAAAAVAERLRGLAAAARVPATLGAAGFGWDSVTAAIPAALRSSGMPWLPEPVDAAGLHALLRRAWAG